MLFFSLYTIYNILLLLLLLLVAKFLEVNEIKLVTSDSKNNNFNGIFILFIVLCTSILENIPDIPLLSIVFPFSRLLYWVFLHHRFRLFKTDLCEHSTVFILYRLINPSIKDLSLKSSLIIVINLLCIYE